MANKAKPLLNIKYGKIFENIFLFSIISWYLL